MSQKLILAWTARRSVAPTQIAVNCRRPADLHAFHGRNRRHIFSHRARQHFAARNLGTSSPRHHSRDQCYFHADLRAIRSLDCDLVSPAHAQHRQASARTSRTTLGGGSNDSIRTHALHRYSSSHTYARAVLASKKARPRSSSMLARLHDPLATRCSGLPDFSGAPLAKEPRAQVILHPRRAQSR